MKNNEVFLIFSKDRALQLQGTIDSLLLNIEKKSPDIIVLYTTTDSRHELSYQTLIRENSQIEFIKESNFKNNVIDILDDYSLIFFICDDTIFVNKFNVNHLKKIFLDNYNAIGFSLRLGLNTTYCYAHDTIQTIPSVTYVDAAKDIVRFEWTIAEYDFGYPLELSSSCYRTYDIKLLVSGYSFNNPNELESLLSTLYYKIYASSYLLCYKTSVAFSNPVNRVQIFNNNRFGIADEYHQDALLTNYELYDIIDIDKYQGIVVQGCHQEMPIYLKNTNLEAV